MKARPFIWLLALAAFAGAAAPAEEAKPPSAEDIAQSAGADLIGKYAPPITLTTLDGKKIELAKLYGRKPVYLKFWATWCVPCRLQMPHFENVQRTLGGDMEVVAVNAGFNETTDAVRRYRETMGLTMPIVIDDGRLADALHLRITPQHIVIGRDGRILHVGHLADARLDRALAQAMAEPPAAYAGAGAKDGGGPARAAAPVLKTLTGETLALRGSSRPTVIFFFSPWCETYLKSSRPVMAQACREAREKASRLAHKAGSRWLGVAAGLWATRNDLSAYQREHSMPMPLALDETGAFFRAFRISDVPSFVELDRAGHIVARTQRADQASRAAARASPGVSPAKDL
jgi:thiol-disulfide isomerase/thioredoxin